MDRHLTGFLFSDCGSVPEIEKGRAKLIGGSTKFGSKAKILCESGYLPEKNRIQCQQNGRWEITKCSRRKMDTYTIFWVIKEYGCEHVNIMQLISVLLFVIKTKNANNFLPNYCVGDFWSLRLLYI